MDSTNHLTPDTLGIQASPKLFTILRRISTVKVLIPCVWQSELIKRLSLWYVCVST